MLTPVEQNTLRDLLIEAVMLLCKTTVPYHEELAVKALIGITIDKSQACMLDFNNTAYKVGSPEEKKKAVQNDPISEGESNTSSQLVGRLGGTTTRQRHGVGRREEGENKQKGRKCKIVSGSPTNEISDVSSEKPDIEQLVKEVEKLAQRVTEQQERECKEKEGELDEMTGQLIGGRLNISDTSCTIANVRTVNHAGVDNQGDEESQHFNTESAQLQFLSSAKPQNENNDPMVDDVDIEQIPPLIEMPSGNGIQTVLVQTDEGVSEHIVLSADSTNHDINEVSKPMLATEGQVISEEIMDQMEEDIVIGQEDIVAMEEVERWEEEEVDSKENLELGVAVEYVQGVAEEEVVGSGEQAEAAAAAQQVLHLMPGETFEYEGTTYQIAPDVLDGEADPESSEILQKVDFPVNVEEEKTPTTFVRKGNHVKGKRPKKFMCSICSQMYTTHWGLKLHERLHRKEYRYHCHICDKGFISTANLKGHMSKHSERKMLTCQFCGREFAYKQSLDRHIAGAPPGENCKGARKIDKAVESSLLPRTGRSIMRKHLMHVAQEGENAGFVVGLTEAGLEQRFEVSQVVA